ncbi:MAG: hypothetical protein SFT94_09030 [Pseudanabaenaceae cyanobacterium bins.68]|nr:hypothetical protein [Pseudanabaenaceae cyanobacterium bins.68]
MGKIQNLVGRIGMISDRLPKIIASIGLMVALVLGFHLEAWANVQVKITDLSYGACAPEVANNMVLGGGVMPANCFMVHGKTVNSSGKTVYNADVFGRIYDANGNDAMAERNRLGSIAEISPGTHDFDLMISVAADQPEPLQFKQFKASGFTGKVRR